jgi:Sigma-70, region 4
MSRLDELPPDQRAALSLLLSQRKTYAEVATLLAIQERAVHDRAHAALAMLAPRQARGLPAERREEVGDYLLGQQPGVAERLATRAYLDGSDPAREWARAISGELAGLARRQLPEIPGGSAAAAAAEHREAPTETPAPPLRARATNVAPPGSPERSLGERLPSSRRGGALLLAAIAVAVIVAVVLITGASSGSHPNKSASRSAASAKTTTGPAIAQRLTLTSPTPGSKTVGVMDILAEGSRRAFFIDAENLPESKGFFYALWLYNSPTSHRPLSASPPVGSTHRLQGGALLPSDAASFHTVLLTRERSRTPSEPGPIVLSGPFSLGA